MFKKYVYTCPDVIHDRKIAKRNAWLAIATNVIFVGGLIVWGRVAERKLENVIDEHENTNS